MAESLWVYEPGDRFVTMGDDGRARIYEVTEEGIPVPAWPSEGGRPVDG